MLTNGLTIYEQLRVDSLPFCLHNMHTKPSPIEGHVYVVKPLTVHSSLQRLCMTHLQWPLWEYEVAVFSLTVEIAWRRRNFFDSPLRRRQPIYTFHRVQIPEFLFKDLSMRPCWPYSTHNSFLHLFKNDFVCKYPGCFDPSYTCVVTNLLIPLELYSRLCRTL